MLPHSATLVHGILRPPSPWHRLLSSMASFGLARPEWLGLRFGELLSGCLLRQGCHPGYSRPGHLASFTAAAATLVLGLLLVDATWMSRTALAAATSLGDLLR